MCNGVTVDRFVFPAVNGEIRLSVPVQIELAQGDTAFDRFFIDARGYDSSVPQHLSWESDVDGD
jgi:hypothetical protein